MKLRNVAANDAERAAISEFRYCNRDLRLIFV